MDLLLWRHAEAEEGAIDLKRRLTVRGNKQAQHVSIWLRERLPKDTRILVSPAVRAQQTAEALGLPFETSSKLAPTCGVADIMSATDWPNGNGAVLVVGHQPAFGQLAALLLSGQEANWTIKKGAVWWFTNRVRQNETQTVLRAVMPADFSR